jgi:YD repeat-containing protein
LARRGQVKRVTVPGGYWREMDYGGAGWLVQRQVQTANGSEVTVYTYDAWGRLRAIDYPRSADVRMGWDGENRRVWVQDGAGRREYTYDAWGRVLEQRGCCGSGEGIEVVAVAAQYDEAGRKRFEKELRSDGSVVRTIAYRYDPLGRLQSIGDYDGPPVPNPTYRRQVVYSYNNTTGRLQMEQYFPNGSYVEYTYYGADNPSQVAFVWKVEHKKSDGSLLIGYEYTYDLLGRIEKSVERPSGDTTVYTYTPAGRLESEVREGQVWYSRYYGYNPDGSRAMVMRDDALNGTHGDVYAYDPVSGRLASVQDELTGEVHSFVWNPEGTLARWEQPNSYARVFGYDEEGRLVKIERDYGAGGVQVAYEYGYNSDGARVWKRDRRDMQNEQEYRYVCGIGCGGVPMRVYNRPMNGGSWASVEDYLTIGNLVLYYNSTGSYMDYRWLPGHWLGSLSRGEIGKMVYRDVFGVTPVPAELDFPAPMYLVYDEEIMGDFQPQAVKKVIVIGGLLLVGILLLWFSLLCWSYYLGLIHGKTGLDDKYEHCMMGCMGVAGCLVPLPPGSGFLWELWQFIEGDQSFDWFDDALATEIGIVAGRMCRRAINPFPISRPGIGSPQWNCCDTRCRLVSRVINLKN